MYQNSTYKVLGYIKILGTSLNWRMEGERMMKIRKKEATEAGITLVALVVTILFSYDEKLKCSSNKGFLLVTI